MSASKVAISIDGALLKRVDALVEKRVFPNRSQAIGVAVREKVERIERLRLADECAKLSVNEERALADEGLGSEVGSWPAY